MYKIAEYVQIYTCGYLPNNNTVVVLLRVITVGTSGTGCILTSTTPQSICTIFIVHIYNYNKRYPTTFQWRMILYRV